MGLDMFLMGHIRYSNEPKSPEDAGTSNGDVELGYWRKHPDLHGFIVNTFAEGKDEGQKIWLTGGRLRAIRGAVRDGGLPMTEGSFFGHSPRLDVPEEKWQYLAQQSTDLEILKLATKWLKSAPKEEGPRGKEIRQVYYLASW